MIADEARRRLVISVFVSLAIHLAIGAFAVWPRGTLTQAPKALARNSRVVEERSQGTMPADAAARTRSTGALNDSARIESIPRARGVSSGRLLPGSTVDFGKITEHVASVFTGATPGRSPEPVGFTSRGDGHQNGSAELARVAQAAGDSPTPSLDRDAARLPGLVEGSEPRRDNWSVLRSIEAVKNGFHSHAAAWINHLWQSTVFAVVAGFLTVWFRRSRAHVRYWLWFSASAKFLVPFALITSLGSHLQSSATPHLVSGQALSATIERISQPFPVAWSSRVGAAASPTPGAADWRAIAILGVWALGFTAIALTRLQMWRRVRAAVRASVPLEIRGTQIPPGVQLRAAPGLLEPGVVGLWRPILLLPAGIEQNLTPAQLDAVLAHEVCHVDRRDNLTAASHMLVEAIFWFHPLVWRIGARLIHERERACDEHVLRVFGNPRAYADGILNLCRRYVDARLACVSGVSGADLKKRIEAIMRNQDAEPLGGWRKLLLAAAGMATVAVPLLVGALGAPLLRAQAPAAGRLNGPAFEAASVKPNQSGRPGWDLESQPGGRLTGTNVPAVDLIRFAYELPSFLVFGGPNWLSSDRFDLVAKADGDAPLAQKRLMLRRLLAERFRLTAHPETRELPYYALIMARSDRRLGPQLRRAQADCARVDQPSLDSGVGPSPANGPAPCGFFGFGPGTKFSEGRGGLAFRGLTMAALAKTFVPMVERSVKDETGLPGYFDGDFDFIAELPLPPPPPGVPSPFDAPFVSVFTVFPEQLGLKLDSRRGPVDVLVIDGAEQPTPD